MKNGKYSVSSFGKLKGKRRMVAALALALILICTVGGTLAYVFTHSNSVENTFTPSHVATKVVETFDKAIKSDVKIQNIGDTDAYIRAAIVVTWKNEETKAVYAKKPVEGTDYSIEWNLTDDGWAKGADGYYYFKKPVAPKSDCESEHSEGVTYCVSCTTDVLINSCAPAGNNAPDGYKLSVEIVASGIQSTPDSVVSAEWDNDKVDVTGNNGVLTVTAKQGG